VIVVFGDVTANLRVERNFKGDVLENGRTQSLLESINENQSL